MSCKLATLIQARKYSKFFTNQGPSLQPLAADSYRGLYSNVLQCAVYLPTYVHKINYQLNSWMGAYWKLFIGTRECFFDHFYFFLTFFQFGPIIEIWFCKQNCKMAYVLALPMDKCEILMKFVIHILKALYISSWKMQEKVEIIKNGYCVKDKDVATSWEWHAYFSYGHFTT